MRVARWLTVGATLFASGVALAVGPPTVRRDRYGDPLPRGAIARLGSMRLRHLFLNALAVSRDGSKVASLGDDLRVWDRATGELLAVFEPRQQFNWSVSFTPDGKQLVSGHQSALLVWDLKTGRCRSLWKDGVDHGTPYNLGFSRDGKSLAVCCELRDKGRQLARFYVLDFPSWKERGVITIDYPVSDIAATSFDSRGHLVIPADGELQVWDAARRKELGRVKVGGHTLALALSPDGKTAAVVQANQRLPGEVKLVNLASARALATAVKDSNWSAIAFRHDGKELLFADDRGAVVALDVKTGKQVRVVAPAQRAWSASEAVFSADGRWLIQADDQTIRIIDMRTGKQSPAFDDHRGGWEVGAVPSPNGRVIATRSSNELRLWESDSGKMLRLITGRELAHGLRWSTDGRQLAVGRRGKFAWYDAQSGRLVREITLPRGVVEEARLLSGGKQVYAEVNDGAKGPTSYLLSAADGRELSRLVPGEHEALLGLSEDGSRTLWSRWEQTGGPTALRVEGAGRCTIWERTFQGRRPPARLFLAGRLVVVPARRVEGWDVDRDRRRGPPAELGDGWASRALAASPDGRMAALDQVHVAEIQQFNGREKGATLLSRVSLVELASGQVRARLPLLSATTGATFTRDGRRLVTSSKDGTALLWDLATLPDRVAPADRWQGLASADARAAFAAVCSLVKSPFRAVELLADRLPATVIDARQVRRWIDDLGSDSYARRGEAERRLAALGGQIEEDLHTALKKKPQLEKRLRLERLLKRMEVNPDELRRGRAIEALERIGTGPAVRLLQRLAQGHPGSRTTREAREALDRLRALRR